MIIYRGSRYATESPKYHKERLLVKISDQLYHFEIVQLGFVQFPLILLYSNPTKPSQKFNLRFLYKRFLYLFLDGLQSFWNPENIYETKNLLVKKIRHTKVLFCFSFCFFVYILCHVMYQPCSCRWVCLGSFQFEYGKNLLIYKPKFNIFHRDLREAIT